jgi:exodeoxyribonuclease V alpha subunit
MSGGSWDRLKAYALEHGALDDIDRVLIDNLAAKARREDDLAFRIVLACLIAAVRSGGLRIPVAGRGLEACLEGWLRGLYAAAARAGGADPDPAGFPEPGDLARRMAEDFTSSRLEGRYDGVLGRIEPGPGKPDPFLPLIVSGEGLYFQRHHAAEALAGARLRRLLDAPDPPFAAREGAHALAEVLERRPLRAGASPDSPPMVFAGAQRAAIELALRKRFCVISGGPGTGKTSLAANLLRAWVRLWTSATPQPPRIRLAAPTGRAAQRLSESIKRSLATVASLPVAATDGAGTAAASGGSGNAEAAAAAAAADAEDAADALVKGLACATLHSLLRYQPATGEFFHHAHRPLPADLVLVDEVSMVDIFLLARLLDALEEGACLVLMGDMDQLPSVEAGSVLADLAPAGVEDHPLRGHLAILDRSHRSDASILGVTRGINAMDAEAALAAMAPPLPLDPVPWPVAFKEAGKTVVPGGGCRFLLPPAARGDAWREGLDDCLGAWIGFHYLGHPFDPARHPGRELATPRRAAYADIVAALCALPDPGDPRLEPLLAEAFAYLEQARILAFTRVGWHGSIALNRRIGARLRRLLDPRDPRDARDARDTRGDAGGDGGFPGAPLLIAENDSARGLFNGDVGLQARICGRDLAWFRRAEGFQSHPTAFLPRHETAFASTVHKAQGSEYDQILLVLPEAGNRLLFKETLYTALTRARHFAGIYGPEEVFCEAIGRKVIRESGLPAYLASSRSRPASSRAPGSAPGTV